jgi:hypothetical protein
MICHQNRLIFLHLPKCGGTSIEVALTGRPWHQNGLRQHQHLTAVETRELYGAEIFRSYFKFAIVRNIWDLLVSHYLWGCSGLRGRGVSWFRWGWEWGHPFDSARRRWVRRPTFAEYLADIPGFNRRLHFSHTGQDLTRQLDAISIDGQIAMDYVGRFEDLPDEFRKICQLARASPPELPHHLKSRRTRHYSDYYAPELRDLVAERYRRDIEAFGFTFERQKTPSA